MWNRLQMSVKYMTLLIMQFSPASCQFLTNKNVGHGEVNTAVVLSDTESSGTLHPIGFTLFDYQIKAFNK